jgi:hypothetical protein
MLLPFAIFLLTAQAPPAPAAAPPKPFDCTAPEHRQFDFWIGTWDVVPNATPGATAPPPSGPPATNVISKAHNGCVLVENWDDGNGGTGQSFNLYDRASRQWHQTWVDSNGGLHQYRGGLKDADMVFMGEVPLPPSSRFQGRRTVRLTFMPMGPDKVRQRSESLNVDGTWGVGYDFIYTRRAKTK